MTLEGIFEGFAQEWNEAHMYIFDDETEEDQDQEDEE